MEQTKETANNTIVLDSSIIEEEKKQAVAIKGIAPECYY